MLQVNNSVQLAGFPLTDFIFLTNLKNERNLMHHLIRFNWNLSDSNEMTDLARFI